MKLKTGVLLSGLNFRMRRVLMVADEIWRSNGEELVVTSGLEGTHSPGSLHYYGYALDFRTRYFDEKTAGKVAHALSKALGPDYLVLLEKTHIHVQLSFPIVHKLERV